jgi:hypothetical protein
MSSLATSTINLNDRRARLVADAVVSAYVSEISPTRRPSRASAAVPAPAARPATQPAAAAIRRRAASWSRRREPRCRATVVASMS